MNIHFKDIELFNILKNNSLFKINVGSTLYGLNDVNSDVDTLYIYPTTTQEKLFPFRNIHQLQFIDGDGNDHLFISLNTFICNILSGDSTINFEVLHTDRFDSSLLSFLSKKKEIFYNYAMAKSYIGLARRDYKYFHKRENRRDIIKGILHIQRGILSSKQLLKYWKGDVKSFEIDFKYLKKIKDEFESYTNIDKETKSILLSLNHSIKTHYDDLNQYYNLNKKTIPHHISTENYVKLNFDLIEFEESEQFLTLRNNIEPFAHKLVELYADAYENWVNY